MHKKNVRFDPVAVEQRIDETRGLALHMATKYARRYREVSLNDLAQDCLYRLTRAAQLYKDRPDGPPFSAFALLCLKQACWDHVERTRKKSREISLNEQVGWDEDGAPFTVADLIEREQAKRQAAAYISQEHVERRLAELRLLIGSLETLTPFERRVLQLRYVAGLDMPDIMRRVGRSWSIVSSASASGVRKLQRHFGLATKPERVKQFRRSHHVNHHLNKGQRHPECRYCREFSNQQTARSINGHT